MNETSQNAAKFEVNGAFNRSPSRDDYFAASVSAAKADFGQSENWRAKLLPPGVVPASQNHGSGETAAVDGKFSTLKVNVRIYYREIEFIEGFALVLATQFCAPAEQGNRQFLLESPVGNER